MSTYRYSIIFIHMSIIIKQNGVTLSIWLHIQFGYTSFPSILVIFWITLIVSKKLFYQTILHARTKRGHLTSNHMSLLTILKSMLIWSRFSDTIGLIWTSVSIVPRSAIFAQRYFRPNHFLAALQNHSKYNKIRSNNFEHCLKKNPMKNPWR